MFKFGLLMEPTVRYSDAELEEFRVLIQSKIEKAEEDLRILKEQFNKGHTFMAHSVFESGGFVQTSVATGSVGALALSAVLVSRGVSCDCDATDAYVVVRVCDECGRPMVCRASRVDPEGMTLAEAARRESLLQRGEIFFRRLRADDILRLAARHRVETRHRHRCDERALRGGEALEVLGLHERPVEAGRRHLEVVRLIDHTFRVEQVAHRHAVLGAGLDPRQAGRGLLRQDPRRRPGQRRPLFLLYRRQRFGRHLPHRQ